MHNLIKDLCDYDSDQKKAWWPALTIEYGTTQASSATCTLPRKIFIRRPRKGKELQYCRDDDERLGWWTAESEHAAPYDDKFFFSECIISAQRTSADPERAHSRSPGRDSRSRSRSGSRSRSPDYDRGTVELPETSA